MRKCIAIFIALSQWLAIAQKTNAEDCGKLTEKYMYNFDSTAANDEFPWIGRVYYEEGERDHNTYLCLAVLISKRHLLIPAQCVAKTSTQNHEPYAVILGADNQCYRNNSCPSPVPNYYEIEEVALHLNLTFHSRRRLILDNNIGIITLKSDVSYNAEVRPICLPSNVTSSAQFVGQYLQYAGYSKDFVQPLKAVAHVASLKQCRDLYNINIGSSYMCVVPDMKEETVFVAGAPLMGVATKGFPAHPHNYYLIGLAAMGSPSYSRNAMDAVISIEPYIEWIRDNII